jgi:hypothetical protein
MLARAIRPQFENVTSPPLKVSETRLQIVNISGIAQEGQKLDRRTARAHAVAESFLCEPERSEAVQRHRQENSASVSEDRSVNKSQRLLALEVGPRLVTPRPPIQGLLERLLADNKHLITSWTLCLYPFPHSSLFLSNATIYHYEKLGSVSV